MIKEEQVILVDKNDNEVGILNKTEVHRKALLHRAVSVFIVNSEGKWLIQQRAVNKYHSGGLWSNATCSHPRPNETNREAAERRLHEEMGLRTKLTEIFQFIYKAELDHGLTEYELDHVFIGISDEIPEINPSEVIAWKYISESKLRNDMNIHPENYTVWFRLINQKVDEHIKNSA